MSAALPAAHSPSTDVVVVGPHSLEHDVSLYLAHKHKRLTAASQSGYRSTLTAFTSGFPGHELADFEPPAGTVLIEDFLTMRWGAHAPRTYNKNFSVIHDFLQWQVMRGRLARDPMAPLERARPRAIHRTTFSGDQHDRIIAANPDPHDQIALRLLLDYGIRKGALRNVQFEHFNHTLRRLVIFTKGEKIQHLPIPDDTVWRHLDDLAEPGHHYLISKQKLRARRSPDRPRFEEASDMLGALLETVAAITDPTCARELGRLAPAIDGVLDLLGLAVATAAVQTSRFPEEPIGEHGAHDWWYRCLARAGIVEKGVTRGQRMHKSRHSAGQRVLDTTGNLKAVQKLLGHANASTTANSYVDWGIEQLDDTMRTVLELPSLATDLARRVPRTSRDR